MNKDEYYDLFHKTHSNLVAFKPLVECSDEVLAMINTAVEQERRKNLAPRIEEIKQQYETAYNRLAMLHTETMAELAATKQMLAIKVNPWWALKEWIKSMFRKYK